MYLRLMTLVSKQYAVQVALNSGSLCH